jgi:hypothetical protein
MLVFELAPPDRFGPLSLFMSRAEVHGVLDGREPVCVATQPHAEYYNEIGLALAFEDFEFLTRIAVSKCSDVAVKFHDVDLLRTSARKALQIVGGASPYNQGLSQVGWMYTFPKLNVQLYRSAGPKARYFDVVVLERMKKLKSIGARKTP